MWNWDLSVVEVLSLRFVSVQMFFVGLKLRSHHAGRCRWKLVLFPELRTTAIHDVLVLVVPVVVCHLEELDNSFSDIYLATKGLVAWNALPLPKLGMSQVFPWLLQVS